MNRDRAFEIAGTFIGIVVVVGSVVATAAAVSVVRTPLERVLVGVVGIILTLAALLGISWLLATLETSYDPPWKPRVWYRRRKRAVCLGDMGHARAWYDPETEELWQAQARFSLFACRMVSHETPEDIIQMLEHVHFAEPYVTKEEVR